MSKLKIGIAQVDFTPRIGLPLKGNFRDDYAARGVHDPLYAKAIVVENTTGRKIALVAMDICMLDRNNVSFMREHIFRETGIPPERILVAATHTHSGPALDQGWFRPRSPEADVSRLLKKAATSVGLACKNMKAAQLCVGYASENRLSFNRRLACRDGKTHMNWEKLDPKFVVKSRGITDPQVIALSIHERRKIKAVVVNFGLHPAILAGDNWLYSADYPGYLSEALRKISGGKLPAMFFNGCCGNVNHIDYADPLQGRGYQMTQRVGYLLAAVVNEALGKSVKIRGDTIAVSSECLVVKRLQISEKQRKWSEAVLKSAKGKKIKGQVDGLPDVYYANLYQEMYKKQHADDRIEIMAIRIGDLGLVGLPGEIFYEFGREIKKRSLAKHTMVIELTNDAIGYIPNRGSFKEGGYEPSVGSTHYKPGTGEEMTAAAIRQLNKLFGGK
ncbi:MAG: neutral/alkaline non-lysosomal ceramidase N-terminal domain-containing protein [Kiritimatiellia bacterium]|nr:neutral/alkaline non-lysosomal ceramidase N-terminal domain-containing protein [Kiritimatiellia bacterium]